ncbi:MAG TPA: type II toxin-antitoxin system VapC family toxin [Nitrospira sp.]|nr:type II toxin-antitoxin system VapC family toxin [Nitrospira sp.]HEV2470182.1 type II toxin-antitoxin system VapC family toxin [Candidatus Sulfotelmatobacter sp.]
MSSVVLDASAVIAVLNQESGAEQLMPHLVNACCSTVNAAEVQGKLVERGLDPDEAWEDVEAVINEILPFTAQHAKAAGTLIAVTRASGLSLGDRSCLALALSLSLPVYTADRSWKHLKLAVPIHVIR